MDDNNWLEEQARYNYAPPPPPQVMNPGDAGYRQSPWSPGYDPGPNWNNGVAPASSDPYQNWNGGSPVDAPLQAGYGWEWQGPQDPIWNTATNDWDRGRWTQVEGRGIGYQAAPTPRGGGDQSPRAHGAVPPIQANIPSASLPSSVQSLFDQRPAQTPIQSAFQDALLKYLGRSQETPSLDDPILRPQSELFRVQAQRDQEKNRRAAAERAAATGRSQSGYLDTMINQGVQNQRLATQQFNANLLGNELNKRREELQSALRIAQATGDAEAARELQSRLAQVQAQMQQQSLNLQGQLGFGDLALRALLAEMGNEQFYDQLGLNTVLGMEGLNQRALEIALGLGG